MRPSSIIYFERIYLISLAFVLVQQVVGFFFARNMFGQFTREGDLPADFGATFDGIMIVAMLFGIAVAIGVPLLFAWLAARKRQEFARWMLLAISILSVLNLLLSIAMLLILPAQMTIVPFVGDLWTTQIVITVADVVAEGAGILALVFVFRKDATAWFRSLHPGASADVFR